MFSISISLEELFRILPCCTLSSYDTSLNQIFRVIDSICDLRKCYQIFLFRKAASNIRLLYHTIMYHIILHIYTYKDSYIL